MCRIWFEKCFGDSGAPEAFHSSRILEYCASLRAAASTPNLPRFFEARSFGRATKSGTPIHLSRGATDISFSLFHLAIFFRRFFDNHVKSCYPALFSPDCSMLTIPGRLRPSRARAYLSIALRSARPHPRQTCLAFSNPSTSSGNQIRHTRTSGCAPK